MELPTIHKCLQCSGSNRIPLMARGRWQSQQGNESSKQKCQVTMSNIALLRITQRDKERMLLECQQTPGPYAARLCHAYQITWCKHGMVKCPTMEDGIRLHCPETLWQGFWSTSRRASWRCPWRISAPSPDTLTDFSSSYTGRKCIPSPQGKVIIKKCLILKQVLYFKRILQMYNNLQKHYDREIKINQEQSETIKNLTIKIHELEHQLQLQKQRIEQLECKKVSQKDNTVSGVRTPTAEREVTFSHRCICKKKEACSCKYLELLLLEIQKLKKKNEKLSRERRMQRNELPGLDKMTTRCVWQVTKPTLTPFSKALSQSKNKRRKQ
ncbi:uncharacterized protein LOC128831696 isoform X2 [Malaclemys terrapin pileata]|uniref:uncharacterized protein LOC128831696 isoform X2 n=1 Tax=Malaclemys terrapin pileata TaxID=2991368 RepID=UPI0023A85EFF|nr:uncharacterized protein LOC128831696 isoform X2 [Malaclemys terrapin pileata]